MRESHPPGTDLHRRVSCFKNECCGTCLWNLFGFPVSLDLRPTEQWIFIVQMPVLLPLGRVREDQRARLVIPHAGCPRMSTAIFLCLSMCWIWILKKWINCMFLRSLLEKYLWCTFSSSLQGLHSHVSLLLECVLLPEEQDPTPPSMPNLCVTSFMMQPLISSAKINVSLVSLLYHSVSLG